ncbi:MAG: SUMF1/EgtB/PvdO family nonheme iron enzyme [Candidatus Marinimicrobia bacterium]|nr:SUMF1/EgtB/PvdO family nonheme iron enzyme [Candidatus Neomarinimicrobiota bacterium]|tara:strand:+ start:313 stop:1359 length:1047 start_codon:yes stop_codon:yes gene_type:complete
MKKTFLIVLPLFLFIGCEKETLLDKDGIKYSSKTNTPYNGIWTNYFENGEISSEIFYVDGKRNGKTIYYNKNGNKQENGNYKNGEKVGNWTGYNKDGEKFHYSIIPGMVYVTGGTFQMGGELNLVQYKSSLEEIPHTVTVSSFYMDKTEVTQAEYRQETGRLPSCGYGGNNLCDECPVECVDWGDAVDYCSRVGKRLPTEAEWEYAARGGNKSKGYKYSGSDKLGDVTIHDNSIHPVGQKQPNELGIYDMSGNVAEWCYDWYGDYSSSSQTDPNGPKSGRIPKTSAFDSRSYSHYTSSGFRGRVVRGGHSANGRVYLRVEARLEEPESWGMYGGPSVHTGIRCVSDAK